MEIQAKLRTIMANNLRGSPFVLTDLLKRENKISRKSLKHSWKLKLN